MRKIMACFLSVFLISCCLLCSVSSADKYKENAIKANREREAAKKAEAEAEGARMEAAAKELMKNGYVPNLNIGTSFDDLINNNSSSGWTPNMMPGSQSDTSTGKTMLDMVSGDVDTNNKQNTSQDSLQGISSGKTMVDFVSGGVNPNNDSNLSQGGITITPEMQKALEIIQETKANSNTNSNTNSNSNSSNSQYSQDIGYGTASESEAGYFGLPDVSGFLDSTYEKDVDIALKNSGITEIYALLLKVGFAVGLIVIAVYGLSWILATPAKKAELKQSIAPIVVGMFILTAGMGPAILVAQTVLGFFENTGGTEAIIVSTTQTAFSIIRTLGVAIAILIILTTGVGWLFANPQKRAELKGKLVNVVIGLAILLGSVTILSFLEGVFK